MGLPLRTVCIVITIISPSANPENNNDDIGQQKFHFFSVIVKDVHSVTSAKNVISKMNRKCITDK